MHISGLFFKIVLWELCILVACIEKLVVGSGDYMFFNSMSNKKQIILFPACILSLLRLYLWFFMYMRCWDIDFEQLLLLAVSYTSKECHTNGIPFSSHEIDLLCRKRLDGILQDLEAKQNSKKDGVCNIWCLLSSFFTYYTFSTRKLQGNFICISSVKHVIFSPNP